MFNTTGLSATILKQKIKNMIKTKNQNKRFIYYSTITIIMSTKKLGVDSEGPYEFTEFSSGQLPFDLGNLEREALSYLGEWKKFQESGAPFGFYYRMGIKQGVIDADGDPATVFLHFVAPFTKGGQVMTPQIQTTLDQKLTQMIQKSTITFSQEVDNAIGIRVSPPDYMLRELVAILPK